jgi:hypothetical protein
LNAKDVQITKTKLMLVKLILTIRCQFLDTDTTFGGTRPVDGCPGVPMPWVPALSGRDPQRRPGTAPLQGQQAVVRGGPFPGARDRASKRLWCRL